MIAPAGQTAALSAWWQQPGVWPQIFSCSSSSLSASSCPGGVVTCSNAQSVADGAWNEDPHKGSSHGEGPY